MTTCISEGCQRYGRARKMCSTHYHQWRVAYIAEHGPLSKTPEERFWSKVNKSASNGCWEWTGQANSEGYGRHSVDGRRHYVHRMSFTQLVGPIPAGMYVDHKCHNTMCVNPAHLRLADHFVNNQNRKSANKNSKSGIRGVSWNKKSKKWSVQIMLNGHHHHLGYFKDISEAETVAIEWRRENMPASITDQLPPCEAPWRTI